MVVGAAVFSHIEKKYGLRQRFFVRIGIERYVFQILLALPVLLLLTIGLSFALHAMLDSSTEGQRLVDIITWFLGGASIGFLVSEHKK